MRMKIRYIPLGTLAAFVTVIGISLLMHVANESLVNPFVNNQSLKDSISKSTHLFVPGAEAVQLPLDIKQFFPYWEKVGDAKSGSYVKIVDELVDPDEHCEFCIRIEYTPGPQGKAGVAFKSYSGVDLKDAKRASFYMKGEVGGEKVKFDAAGKNAFTTQSTGSVFTKQKFAVYTQEVILSNDWQKYEIDLSSADLTKITHPFAFELTKGSNPGKTVFYLKIVIYDAKTANNPVPILKIS